MTFPSGPSPALVDRRRFLRRALRGAAALPLVAACQSPAGQLVGNLEPVGTPAPAFPTPPPGASVFVVEMREMRFSPEQLSIPAGAVVRWENRSRFAHTATGDPALALHPAHAVRPEGAGAWDSGLVLPGRSWARLFSVPGDYTYFCLPHEDAGMIGAIEVTA